MRAHRMHAVVNAVPAASWLALNAVKRCGMDDRSRRPRGAGRVGSARNFLQRNRTFAETARNIRARCGVSWIVAGDDPRSRNWIFAEFHLDQKENTEREAESTAICHSSLPPGRLLKNRRIAVLKDAASSRNRKLCEIDQGSYPL